MNEALYISGYLLVLRSGMPLISLITSFPRRTTAFVDETVVLLLLNRFKNNLLSNRNHNFHGDFISHQLRMGDIYEGDI